MCNDCIVQKCSCHRPVCWEARLQGRHRTLEKVDESAPVAPQLALKVLCGVAGGACRLVFACQAPGQDYCKRFSCMAYSHAMFIHGESLVFSLPFQNAFQEITFDPAFLGYEVPATVF